MLGAVFSSAKRDGQPEFRLYLHQEVSDEGALKAVGQVGPPATLAGVENCTDPRRDPVPEAGGAGRGGHPEMLLSLPKGSGGAQEALGA